jgi:hypothetical protein
MKTEDKQARFFDLYSNYNFEDIHPEEQQFVRDFFSVDEYNQLRELHCIIENQELETFDIDKLNASMVNTAINKASKKSNLVNRSIPFYKVAVMLILTLSTGLFFGRYLNKPVEKSNLSIAFQDSTMYNVPKTIAQECTGVAIMSETMVNPYEMSKQEIKTVSTCEIKQILKNQPKKVDNQMIDDFPLVSF